MERADQVLAVGRVDAGLAADRGIDLGQQRRRDLDEAHAPPHDRRREAGEVADHAAAERHHEVAALHAGGDHARRRPAPASRRTSWPRPAATHDLGGADAGRCERGAQGGHAAARHISSVTMAQAAPGARAAMRAPAPLEEVRGRSGCRRPARPAGRGTGDRRMAARHAVLAVSSLGAARWATRAEPPRSALMISSTTTVVRHVARVDGDVGQRVDGVADSISRRSVPSGSGFCSSGRLERLRTRRISTSKSAFSQIEMPELGDAAPGLLAHEGAAAGGQHPRPLLPAAGR